jgi:PIN domain nuclease of toxin-antitoxin system
MKYLLDTHTLIWTLNSPEKLSILSKTLIEDEKYSCFVSKSSLIEIAIKKNLGKLNFYSSFEDLQKELSTLKIEILEIELDHLEFYLSLPQNLTHKDPFDRLIISTGAVEGLKIISKDEKFNLYPDIVETVW